MKYLTTLQLDSSIGSATEPALNFSGDPNTGIYLVGADDLGFSSGGALRLNIGNINTTINNTLMVDSLTSTPNSLVSEVIGEFLFTNSGNALGDDSSGNNYNADSVGSVVQATNVTAGSTRASVADFNFDGTQLIEFDSHASSAFTDATNFTVAFWFRFKSAPGVGTKFLMHVRQDNDNEFFAFYSSTRVSLMFGLDTSGVRRYNVYINGNFGDDTDWAHYIFQTGTGGPEMYRNGVSQTLQFLDGSSSTHSIADFDGSPTRWEIGNSSGSVAADSPYQMDDVRFFDKVLSVQEIADLSESGAESPPAGNLTYTSILRLINGTKDYPSLAFDDGASNYDTGIYSVGADDIGFTTGGTLRMDISTSAVTSTIPFLATSGTVSAPGYSFSGDSNTGIYQASLDTIGFSTSTNLRMSISNSSITCAEPVTINYNAGNPQLCFVRDGGGNTLDMYLDATDGFFVKQQIGADITFLTSRGTTFIISPQTVATTNVEFLVRNGNTATFDTLFLVNQNAITLGVQTKIINGTVAAPSYSFSSDPDTGLYSVSGGNIGFSANGVLRMDLSTSALTLGDAIKLNVDAAGGNAITGTATLSAGTITVNTTAVTTNSIIQVSRNTVGGTLGNLSVPSASITASTSFVINSDSGAETSTVNWFIIN